MAVAGVTGNMGRPMTPAKKPVPASVQAPSPAVNIAGQSMPTPLQTPNTAPYSQPGMMQDPNNGNLFQWRPDQPNTNGGWSLFSTGDGPGAGAGGNGRNPANGFDAIGAFARTKSMMPKLPARVAAPNPANRAAAESAAFSRAKDRTGQAMGGLMKSIGSSFESRGLGGSSLEADAMGSGMEAGFGELSDVIREQAINGLARDYDVEDRNYATDVQQRGQDIGGQGQKMSAIMSLMKMIQQGAY